MRIESVTGLICEFGDLILRDILFVLFCIVEAEFFITAHGGMGSEEVNKICGLSVCL